MPPMVFNAKGVGMKNLLFQINYEWYIEKAKSVTLLNTALRFKNLLFIFLE